MKRVGGMDTSHPAFYCQRLGLAFRKFFSLEEYKPRLQVE